MVENLRLQDKTISAADSNLPSGKTVAVPASSTDLWCTTNSAACDDQLMTLDSGSTSYGNYYNWYTATATYGTYSISSGNISYSICPKGWRLPTGGSGGEFQTLYNQYPSSASILTIPSAFTLSGARSGGTTSDQNDRGYYWSSVAYDSNGAYRLYLNSSNVYPATNNSKYVGLAVRCVAQ